MIRRTRKFLRMKPLNHFSMQDFSGQKAGTFNPRASYCGVDVEWLLAKDEFFIQVGDVFDRADHSELSAEILRQMILQAPAHVFVLVGKY